jgi:hypothetical protein
MRRSAVLSLPLHLVFLDYTMGGDMLFNSKINLSIIDVYDSLSARVECIWQIVTPLGTSIEFNIQVKKLTFINSVIRLVSGKLACSFNN